MKVTVIYGTDNGATRSIAKKIGKKLAASDIKIIDVANAKTADFEASDLLILGSPTYGFGELPADWEKALALLSASNLADKTVALFGTGDQVNYPDTFADALGILYDRLTERRARVIGATDPAGYSFDGSTALRDGRFVGLVLDQDNQYGMTEGRIDQWIAQLQ